MANDDRARYEEDFDTSRTKLPIYHYREGLLEAFDEFQVLIVVGDTGSGKTTQLPQFIHEHNPSQNIFVTQPRRIAAISAAARVASETHSHLGGLVGYAVRFEKEVSSRTKITYVTDGTLLQMAKNDLSDTADVVILDEAHERSLETDVLFGILKKACRTRPTLKLIIMSATLNMDKFSDFFDKAPVFTVPGRMFPVDLLYARQMKMAALKSQIVSKSVEAVVQIHKTQPAGDVLVFLTGQQEIETTCRLIREECELIKSSSEIQFYPEVSDISLHPIYSALDTPDQRQVFRPAKRGFRKIVIATNIAQTSVTIPGIRYVVDCGFVKEKMFDPSTGVDALLVVPISKAAATQRAGRSGRTAPGKVFRLYSREAFEDMAEDTTPEIQRSSLLGTVLSLKQMGIEDILNFEFIDPPEREHLITAIKQLYYLDALDEVGNLTDIGKQMSQLPLHPCLSRSLLASPYHSCTAELLTLVAILSSEDLLHHPRNEHQRAAAELAHAKFGHKSGDHVAMLRVYDAWVAAGENEAWCKARFVRGRSLRGVKNVRKQLEETVRGMGLEVASCRREAKKGEARRGRERQDQRRDEGRRRRDRDDYDFVLNHEEEDEWEEDLLAEYDSHAILKSVSAGFFSNTAKRHPQRNHFYHYLAASGASTGTTGISSAQDSNAALLSLHIQPGSCLSGPSSNIGGISDTISSNLEWVVYHDVQFVNRANMRTVSRIDFSWVEKGIQRVAGCDVKKLLGLVDEVVEEVEPKKGKRKRTVDEPAVKEVQNVAQVSTDLAVDPSVLKAKNEERVKTEQVGRDLRAEAAKQRYLSRKKK
ncbi:ATP-dependent RNA helicase dhx8 [Podochytrium sp. JEL0797]|nr:ATP-dependent RNA helicase dhx8 [Podochytrium sp. JEL0797]